MKSAMKYDHIERLSRPLVLVAALFVSAPLAAQDDPAALVIRVDDTPHPFKLEGKQGYGPARGTGDRPGLYDDGHHRCLSRQ